MIMQKCAFRYKMPLFFSSDPNLKELKTLIKKYYLGYGYFVMDTTVEGALITKENLDQFAEYFRWKNANEKGRPVETMEQLTRCCHKQELLNMYRIYYKGKCDLVLGLKELKKNNLNILKKRNDLKDPNLTKEVENLYSFLESGKEGKTGGWVSNWIEYFICSVLQVDVSDADRFNKVKRMMDTELGEEVRDQFAAKFRELDEWMTEIEKRYKGEINRRAVMS